MLTFSVPKLVSHSPCSRPVFKLSLPGLRHLQSLTADNSDGSLQKFTCLKPRYMICSSLRVNLVSRQRTSSPSGLILVTWVSTSSSSRSVNQPISRVHYTANSTVDNTAICCNRRYHTQRLVIVFHIKIHLYLHSFAPIGALNLVRQWQQRNKNIQ